MLFAFAIILFITVCSTATTYVFLKNAPLWVRLCAGAVIGQVVFGTMGFVVASFIGMGAPTIFVCLAACGAQLLLFRNRNYRRQFNEDVAALRQNFQQFTKNFPLEAAARFALYAALFTLLWWFFDRAMVVKPDGIYIGSSNNLGDLPFHLQGIYGFTDGQNFPPQNPSFAGSKFTYPFVVNLVAAMLIKTGAAVETALFWQNITLITAFVGLFWFFTFRWTGSRTAAHIAPFLFLFSGGLGFAMFLSEAVASEKGIFGLLMNLQNDYSLRPDSTWRWGNALTVLLITQRSMLIGLPFTLLILTGLWKIFAGEKDAEDQRFSGENSILSNLSFSPFRLLTLGLLAGTLPLVHAHSFAVVMFAAGCLALFSLQRWFDWSLFFVGAALVAVPELAWAMFGTANRAETFVAWQFGWDKGEENFFWFWLKNTGLFVPLLIAAIFWLLYDKNEEEADEKAKSERRKAKIRLLLFWIPFALCFVAPNLIKMAPWIWDNIKVLIYWFLISVPLVAWLLAQIWRQGAAGKLAALSLIFVLTFAGFLDVWRVASHAFEYKVFERDAVNLARQMREKTPPRALVMSAPTYNSPVVLTGRRWFLGFTGHLWSHGIIPTERENDLKRIYAGAPDAPNLIQKNAIDYVVVSPLEREMVSVNDAFFSRFQVVAQSGQYRVYQVK
jgi:hypothetical protein